MNTAFFVAVLCAVAFATVDLDVPYGKLSIVEIPKDKSYFSFKCSAPAGSQMTIIRVSACFGSLSLYNDTTEIDPMSSRTPLIKFDKNVFSKSYGYGTAGPIYGLIKAEDVTSTYYTGNRGVFEILCVNDFSSISNIPSLKTGITTSVDFNKHTGKITFPLNNDKDYNYQVFTHTMPHSSYKPSENPPQYFFNSACSASLWQTRRPDAESIHFTDRTGTVTINGMNKAETTIATITYGVTENAPHVYATSVALNASGKVAPIVFLTLLIVLFTFFF